MKCPCCGGGTGRRMESFGWATYLDEWYCVGYSLTRGCGWSRVISTPHVSFDGGKTGYTYGEETVTETQGQCWGQEPVETVP